MTTHEEEQTALWDEPDFMVQPRTKIERAFVAFHAENPHVLQDLERRAFALVRAGRRRIGVKMIWEAMRYDRAVQTQGEDWKLNNSYTALYARLLLHRHPILKTVIETRIRKRTNGK